MSKSPSRTDDETPSPRQIAACIESHTHFRDPIVDYADADSANLWVDVRGKVDCLDAPFRDHGVIPATIHPTISDHDEDVTRVWYRKVDTGEQ